MGTAGRDTTSQNKLWGTEKCPTGDERLLSNSLPVTSLPLYLGLLTCLKFLQPHHVHTCLRAFAPASFSTSNNLSIQVCSRATPSLYMVLSYIALPRRSCAGPSSVKLPSNQSLSGHSVHYSSLCLKHCCWTLLSSSPTGMKTTREQGAWFPDTQACEKWMKIRSDRELGEVNSVDRFTFSSGKRAPFPRGTLL